MTSSHRDRLVHTLDPGAGACRRVIVSLHGSGFTSQTHSEMIDADELCRGGALVVTPQALIPFRFGALLPEGFAWNVPGAPLPGEDGIRDGPDDVGFIGELLTDLRASHPDLPIHLLGYSGGARLASHVLAGDRTPASAGLVAGALFVPTASSCAAAVLAIHGRRDDVNPYDGGDEIRWPTGIRRTMQSWAGRSGGGDGYRERDLESGVHERRFDGSGDGTVRLVSLAEVGHTWPGTRDALCVRQFGPAGNWSATEHLGAFFAEFDGWPPVSSARRGW